MKKTKLISLLLVCVLLIGTLSGCAELNSLLGEIKGELIGRDFNITIYDHWGNPTTILHGSKVHVGLLQNSANLDSESGFKSEVLEITINGKEVHQIGKTAIFAEKGLDMVTDFAMDSDIESDNGGVFMPFDRLVNNYANSIGKKKTIIISSQLGIPIGVYQGDSVYVEVPTDLPKMTLLNIDGKALYISRATYEIIDSELLK